LGGKAVAEVLGCSVGVVKVRTHRVMRKLREAIRMGCRFYQDKRGVLGCEPSDASKEGGE